MARDFNGSSDQLSVAANAALRPGLPVTVSAWVKPDVLQSAGIYTSNKVGTTHSGFWVAVDAAGNIESSFGDNTGGAGTDRQSKVTTATPVTVGAWRHVAATIRGASDMTIYAGGVDAGGAFSGTGGAMAYNVANGSRIGFVGSAGAAFFDGLLAEVAVWTVSLSDSEVASLSGGVSPLDVQGGNLLAYWPICGVQSPEPDYKSGFQATVTGTTPASYPFDSEACRGADVDQHASTHIGRGSAW